jgi:K+-transporting ATPase KdpF subunit
MDIVSLDLLALFAAAGLLIYLVAALLYPEDFS